MIRKISAVKAKKVAFNTLKAALRKGDIPLIMNAKKMIKDAKLVVKKFVKLDEKITEKAAESTKKSAKVIHVKVNVKASGCNCSVNKLGKIKFTINGKTLVHKDKSVCKKIKSKGLRSLSLAKC